MDNRQNWDRYGQGGYQGGWNQVGRTGGQWDDQPDYGSDSFENRNPSPNPSYGEVYHGNVQQREEQTNRARGRGYNQGGGMQYGAGRHEREYSQGGYGQVGNTGGGHGDWNSSGSSNQDMGRGYQPGRIAGWGNPMNMGGYGNQGGYGGQGGNYGRDYRTGGMNQNYESRRYSRENRHDDDDQSWWDRARNQVASWFNDDDNDDRKDYRSSDYRSGGGSQRMSGSMGTSGGSRTMGEHRGKGPRGYQRSEERIREDVCYRLYEDGYVDASDIEVKVEGSEVILTGTVHSREEKRRAEDLVENIMGVRNVENRLRVENDRGGWQSAGSSRMGMSDSSRMGDNDRNTSSYGSGSASNRSYTGNTGEGSGIGSESGTTNEIIRNSGNLDKDR